MSQRPPTEHINDRLDDLPSNLKKRLEKLEAEKQRLEKELAASTDPHEADSSNAEQISTLREQLEEITEQITAVSKKTLSDEFTSSNAADNMTQLGPQSPSASNTSHYTFKAGTDLKKVQKNVNKPHASGLEALKDKGYGVLLKDDIKAILEAHANDKPEDLNTLTTQITGIDKHSDKFNEAQQAVLSQLQKAKQCGAGLLVNAPEKQENAYKALMAAGKEHGVEAHKRKSSTQASPQAPEPKRKAAPESDGDDAALEEDTSKGAVP